MTMLYTNINVYNPYIYVHEKSPIFVYTFLKVQCTYIKMMKLFMFILYAAEIRLVECNTCIICFCM